jgi:hypothetical protein
MADCVIAYEKGVTAVKDYQEDEIIMRSKNILSLQCDLDGDDAIEGCLRDDWLDLTKWVKFDNDFDCDFFSPIKRYYVNGTSADRRKSNDISTPMMATWKAF